MVDIYAYIDPAAYIRDKLEEKKQKNRSFSLRSWARQLGMKSHGPLHAIINGQRGIPKKFVPLFIQHLGLDRKESNFFEALVDFQRAKRPEEKEFYQKRLETLSPKELRKVEDFEGYKYLSDPLHIILAELTELKGFRPDAGWIKQRLLMKPGMKDIEEVIQRLILLGILKQEGSALKKQVKHIYTKKEMMNQGIQLYHKEMIKLSNAMLEQQDVSEREYNGVSFNIKLKDMPKIKESIREFVDQLIQNYEAPSGEGEETYHLNVHLFRLSRK